MEAVAGETATVSIGKFLFSKINFEKAIQIIRDSIHKDGWLIMDEIGPLELRGGGFHDVLMEVLAQRQNRTMLVIRSNDNITDKIKQHFELNSAITISSIGELADRN